MHLIVLMRLILDNDVLLKKVLDVYEEILKKANYVLQNSKRFSIKILKDENPTYSQIASMLEDICEMAELITKHTDDCKINFTLDKMITYTREIKEIAKAVENGCENELAECIVRLDKMSFL